MMHSVEKRELLHEGKAKKVYVTSDPELLLIEYTDTATAFNGKQKATIPDKGALNSQISAAFFGVLSQAGIGHHWVKTVSATEHLVRRVTIVPLEVVVHNIAAGSISTRLGLEEGAPLWRPIVDFYFKNDALEDPLVTEDHIAVLKLATTAQVAAMRAGALRINEVLREFLHQRQITLVDFKLEYGVTSQGELLLADEISPDTCRFWDVATGEKLDKDRFRRNLGGVAEAYREVYRRIGGDNRV